MDDYARSQHAETVKSETDETTRSQQAETVVTESSQTIIGKTIAGYQFQGQLGRGGMGVVYLAHDKNMDQLVAMKTLHSEMALDPFLLDKFLREARVLRQARNPNIVEVFTIAELQPYGKFIVMEYVQGENLADRLRREKVIHWKEALPLFIQALSAISHAHEKNIIHRDLKPANLIVTESGHLKVADFGLARMPQKDTDPNLSQGVAGTPRYMPPEQLMGLQYTDEKTDIYSLGVSFYEMLTGKTPAELRSKDYNGQVPEVHVVNDSVPRQLSAIIMRAIQLEPAARWPGARAMLTALEDFHRRQEKIVRFRIASALAVAAVIIIGFFLIRQFFFQATYLSVTTVPVGARVFLEGTEIGLTPLTQYEIENRRQDLRITLNGHAPIDTFINPGAGQHLFFTNLQLPEAFTTTMNVFSEPSGARVLLDGESIGVTPLADYVLAVGDSLVRLRLEYEGYAPVDTAIQTIDQTNITLNLNLPKTAVTNESSSESSTLAQNDPSGNTTTPITTPSTDTSTPETNISRGTLVLSAHPGGSMSIDGQSVSPGRHSVSSGTHVVTCGNVSHASRQTVTVGAEKTVDIACFTESRINVNTAWEGQQSGLAPAASISVDDVQQGASPMSSTYGPGSYMIEADFPVTQPYQVVGGQYIIKNRTGESLRTENFSGSSIRVAVEPNFDEQRHLISFYVRRTGS